MPSEYVESALKASAYNNELLKVMDYAVFPAGKLFRPRLVEALAYDLDEEFSDNYKHLAAAIELHHAYTLVHDDLPSMDNDLIRRGKPSTHVQFGEWKAILGGDALLVSSFHELHKIRHEFNQDVFRLFSWATGGKGLILGQYLDLNAKGTLGLKEIIRIHELKTARLLQIATLGSFLLSTKTKSLFLKRRYLRLGREIGVCFQLLDDLSDLTEGVIGEHEKEINPFLIDRKSSLKELQDSHKRLVDFLNEYHHPRIKLMLSDYFSQSQSSILTKMHLIKVNLNTKDESNDLEDWLTTSLVSF